MILQGKSASGGGSTPLPAMAFAGTPEILLGRTHPEGRRLPLGNGP